MHEKKQLSAKDAHVAEAPRANLIPLVAGTHTHGENKTGHRENRTQGRSIKMKRKHTFAQQKSHNIWSRTREVYARAFGMYSSNDGIPSV